jgi:hypothetical protein
MKETGMKAKHTPVTVVKNPPIVCGEPMLCDDGHWHVKWFYQDGTTRITGFGWKEREYAESHVQTLVSNQAEIENLIKGAG